ncbi:MAG: cation transporter [Sphingobacteriaceae bacterium]|nr:MAG: cation transporter [Sphingobacteriaceae bacterium]
MQLQKRIILYALITGFILMIAKFAAYFITDSNFILTDAAESIVNVVASAFAFFSIWFSARPRDINHPYGHGKVEFFSVFLEGALIMVAGIIIIVKSIYNVFHPHEIQQLLIGALIIGLTGAINGALGFYMIKQGKKMLSLTIEADGRHLITDAVTSAGLVLGLTLIYFTKILMLDSILSIVVGLFIVYTAYKLVRKSVAGLMDETDFNMVEDILTIMNKNRKEEWIDVHNMRAQRYGNELHIDCHMTLPNYFDLTRVHHEVSLADQIVNKSTKIKTEFFIHADPCIPECCYYCRMPNCPIRSHEKTEDYLWDMERVAQNNKHFATETITILHD